METPSLKASQVSLMISSGVIGTWGVCFFVGIMPVGASLMISFPTGLKVQSSKV